MNTWEFSDVDLADHLTAHALRRKPELVGLNDLGVGKRRCIKKGLTGD